MVWHEDDDRREDDPRIPLWTVIVNVEDPSEPLLVGREAGPGALECLQADGQPVTMTRGALAGYRVAESHERGPWTFRA